MALLNERIKGAVTDGVWGWIKTSAIQLIVSAENSLAGATCKEKRKFVVNKLDELIVLPGLLEIADGFVLGLLVDWLCDRLNILTNGNKGAVAGSENLAAQAVEASDDVLNELGPEQLSLSEKFSRILASAGIGGNDSELKKN